jgi:O-antigen/teichoic acid export membrane protein
MNSDLKTSVISGIKWLAFSKAVIQLFRWLSTFWVIRLLDPKDYGVMAIAEIMAALLVSVNYLCIGNAIIRFKAVSKPIINTLFTCCLITGVILFSLQFFSAEYFAQFYQTPEAAMVLQIIAITYLIECFNVKPMALMAKDLKFKQLAKIDLIVGLSMPTTVLICAYMGMGYWALAIGHIVNAVMKTLIANIIYPTVMQLGFRFKRTLPLLKFGFKNTLTSVIAQLNSSLDFIIGGYYLTPSQIGIYQVGLQISFIPLRKISPELRRISFPSFSKVKQDKKKVVLYYLKSTRLISFLVFPIFWGISSISEVMVGTILGDKWINASEIIMFLCLFLPLKLLTEMTNSMLNALGEAGFLLISSIFSLIVFLISIFMFLDYGLIGLCYSWGITILCTYLFSVFKASRVLSLSLMDIFKEFYISLIGCFIMFIFIFQINTLLQIDDIVLLFVQMLIGFATYVLFSMFFQKSILVELKSLKS